MQKEILRADSEYTSKMKVDAQYLDGRSSTGKALDIT